MFGVEGLSMASSMALMVLVALLALFFVLLLWWQVQVLKGRAMDNPDGSVDDWHDQEILYGMAVADVFIACPLAFAGVAVVFLSPRHGVFLLALVSFFFIWVNVAFTKTSLRFRRPRITLNWFIVYPFGALLGLAFLVWTMAHFDVLFV